MTRFGLNTTCQLYSLKAPDTIEYLMTTCPYFTSFRIQYLQNILPSSEQIPVILSSSDLKTIDAIINFLTKSLRLREWALHL